MNASALADFVQVLDNILPERLTAHLVAKATELGGEIIEARGHHSFASVSLHRPELEDTVNPIISYLLQAVRTYMELRCVPEEQFPLNRVSFEELRIKRYPAGVGHFDTHVDVADKGTALRALACFWYLNDVERGGETEFFDQAGNVLLSVKPQRGRMVIFPPMWMFPHRGVMPVSNDKFFLGTYLHYT